MKYKLMVDYTLRFHRRDVHPYCQIHFSGMFSSNALPRKGETVIIPIAIRDPWRYAAVSGVVHSGTKGVLHHHVECKIDENVDVHDPTPTTASEVRDKVLKKIIPEAAKFGLTTKQPQFREPFDEKDYYDKVHSS